MRCLLYLILSALVVLMFSCKREAKISVADRLNPEKMPTMTTKNVATFISDSGIVQYKIVSPIWFVYDRRDTSFWRFPEGLYLKKYDPSFRVISTVAADSAVYFKKEKIWRLDGNVELTKVPKDLFLTSQLFWDERRGQLYSDSFIHIETATHVLEGYGFVSNDRLTKYRIINPTGIFPAERGPGNPAQSPLGAETSVATDASQASVKSNSVSTSFVPKPE